MATLSPIIVQQKTTLPVLNCSLLVGLDFSARVNKSCLPCLPFFCFIVGGSAPSDIQKGSFSLSFLLFSICLVSFGLEHEEWVRQSG